MWRTFNNGIGLVIAVPAEAADTALSVLHGAGEAAWRLGRVVACGPEGPVLQWP
jgi:phosphoribosylformylglycinamidine cyclo-ligase